MIARVDRRGRILLAAGLVVAVVATVLVLVLRDDRPSIAIASPSTSTTTGGSADPDDGHTATIGPDGGRVEGPGGVVVIVPEGALDGPGRVTVVPVADDPELGEAVEVVGQMVDVSVEGATLTGSVQLEFPIGDEPTTTIPGDAGVEELTPSYVVAHRADDGWEGLVGEVSADRSTVTVTTTSLSPFGLVRIATGFVVDLIENLLTEITGGLVSFVPTPDCGDGADDASNWTSTPAAAPYEWCAHTSPDGTRRVQVVNRRRYAITAGGDGAVVTASSTDLSAQLSGLLNPTGVVTLAPGEVATFSFPGAVPTPEVVAEYDGVAQSLTALSVAAEIMALIAGKVPFAKKKSAKEFLRMLDRAQCVTSLGIDLGSAVRHPASTIAKLVVGCLDEVISSGLGVLGVVLGGVVGVIGGTIAFFVSSATGVFDLLIGGAAGNLRRSEGATGSVVPPPSSDPPPTDPPAGTTAWPEDDNEGPPALFALIGAELIGFPNWSSCIPEWCIAGIDDRVRAYAFDPGPVFRGSIADTAATPADAVAALVEAGFNQEQAAGLAAPGPA